MTNLTGLARNYLAAKEAYRQAEHDLWEEVAGLGPCPRAIQLPGELVLVITQVGTREKGRFVEAKTMLLHLEGK